MATTQTIYLNRSLPDTVKCVIYIDGSATTMTHIVVNTGKTTGNAILTVTFPTVAEGSYVWRVFDVKNNSVYRTSIYTFQESVPAKTFVSLTDGATITWDYDDGYNAKVTLGGNRTLAISNAEDGDAGTLVVKQDAQGSRTLTLPSGSLDINAGITLSTTANAIDILAWLYDGTNFYWNIGNGYA